MTRGIVEDFKDPVRQKLERQSSPSTNIMALGSFGAIFFITFPVREMLGVEPQSIFDAPALFAAIADPALPDRLLLLIMEYGFAVLLFFFTVAWY